MDLAPYVFSQQISQISKHILALISDRMINTNTHTEYTCWYEQNTQFTVNIVYLLLLWKIPK